MDCNQVNGMLDMLMDGALSEEQLKAMEAHGRECPECAAAIRSTRQMKALFEQMEPEADVPLEAQARWRGAVRAAAREQGRKRLRRWIASAAAAVVVLVGVGMAFRQQGALKQNAAPYSQGAPDAMIEAGDAEAVVETDSAPLSLRADAASGAVVEADGMAEEAVAIEEEAAAASEEAYAVSGQRAPACELVLQVGDVTVACDRVCDLAQEYEAVADVQTVENGGANVYVDIAAENAGDFLDAVVPMDESGQALNVPRLTGSGRVLVLLVLHNE